jgi:hypothetical protein
MKGFILCVDEECISGAVDEGITGIIVTYRDNQCRVHFSSLNKDGMQACIWYTADMKEDDCLNICFENITSVSETKKIIDYNKLPEESMKENLELYRKLKKELTEEGLINEE